MLKNIKGSPGYIQKEKKRTLVKLLIAAALVAALIALGTSLSGTRLNVLTLIAVLGCLPLCRVLVSLITLWPYTSYPTEACARVREAAGENRVFFDFVFTSPKAIYPVAAIAVKGRTVCGYMREKTQLASDAEEHLKKAVRAEGIRQVSIHLFTEEEKFLERLKAMRDIEKSGENREAVELSIANLFMNFSL